MPRWSSATLAVLAGALVLAAWNGPEPNGKELFERRCRGCHALDHNKEGPRLRGVYGRAAGGVADFEYSDALKKTAVRWYDASLDRWLSDPESMAPGTDMAFRVPDADVRKALIGYLRTLARSAPE